MNGHYDIRMLAPLSRRGLPLIWSRVEHPAGLTTPVLTAECYSKWYELYLVRNTGTAIVGFAALEDLGIYSGSIEYTPHEAAYRDHAPNPRAVEAYAEHNNCAVDLVMLYVAMGMWEETSEEADWR